MTAKVHSNKKRWLIGCGCVLAAGLLLLLLAAGVVAWGLGAAFDREPTVGPPEMADPAALMTATQKIQTAAQAALLDQDPAARPQAGQEPLLLELNGAEVDALLLTGIGLQQGMAVAEKGADTERVDCRFQDGAFLLRFGKRMEFDTPFGNWVNVTARFIPEIRDGRLSLTLTECRLGNLPMPLDKIQRRLAEREIPEFERSTTGQIVLRLVERMETGPDGVAVRYRPQALTEALSGVDVDSIFNLLGAIGEME